MNQLTKQLLTSTYPYPIGTTIWIDWYSGTQQYTIIGWYRQENNYIIELVDYLGHFEPHYNWTKISSITRT